MLSRVQQDDQQGPAHAFSAAAPLSVPAPAPSGPQRWHGALVFVANFLRHPLQVGTAFRSSRALVRRIADGSPWPRYRRVLELGPGVGTVTAALLQRLPADARLLAVEANPHFVAELQRTLPDRRLLLLPGDAADLPDLLARHTPGCFDAVVSGIPFSTMPIATRRTVLDAVVAALADDGELLVYQHSALVLPLLRERFDAVAAETEWRSLVPMRVFRCRRPLRAR